MKRADRPFQFVTASYLTRIRNQTATNLKELGESLEKCSDESIFYHTFHTLGRHHFLTEGFSNDFAHWVLAATNQAELAEELAGLDIRDYVSLAVLREDLRRLVISYCDRFPALGGLAAFEPFHFCESIEVSVPLGREAWTLEEFRDGLANLARAALHFHFISSRLRLRLRTNDFSLWLSGSLGLTELAQRVNRVDIYTNTLDGVRDRLLAQIGPELRA
ncbi:MAG TPA: DUF5752 family protein [Terriglobia bacterium]|nr:DUF5752 family protein [Terriglobia bacterium]